MKVGIRRGGELNWTNAKKRHDRYKTVAKILIKICTMVYIIDGCFNYGRIKSMIGV